MVSLIPLQWRHNERDGVSNHQPHNCLLNRYSGADQRKQQSSASLAFVRGIHRRPVNSPHKRPVTLKMFPFDDVIMICLSYCVMITGRQQTLRCGASVRSINRTPIQNLNFEFYMYSGLNTNLWHMLRHTAHIKKWCRGIFLGRSSPTSGYQ